MGLILIILSWPMSSTILTNPKPLTYHLPYLFIHYLTGPHTTLISLNPTDPGPLESHTYHKTVRSRNVVKPTYYIGGILSFYLIDLGTSTQFINKTVTGRVACKQIMPKDERTIDWRRKKEREGRIQLGWTPLFTVKKGGSCLNHKANGVSSGQGPGII